jgi:hypothetical protein
MKKQYRIGLITFAVGCVLNSACQPRMGCAAPSDPRRSEGQPQPESQVSLTISSVEFFALHRKGAKETYDKIKALEVKNANMTIGPEKFDLVVQVENRGRSSIAAEDLIILTTMEFIVAPGDPRNASSDRVMSEYTWSRDLSVDDVKMALVPFLDVGKQTRIELKGFDLSKQNEVVASINGSEHVWALRATIHVLDRRMVEILRRNAVISLPN